MHSFSLAVYINTRKYAPSMLEVVSSLSPNSPAYKAGVICLFTERVFLCLATGINSELVTMRLLKGNTYPAGFQLERPYEGDNADTYENTAVPRKLSSCLLFKWFLKKILCFWRAVDPEHLVFLLTSSGLASHLAAVTHRFTPGHSDAAVWRPDSCNKT